MHLCRSINDTITGRQLDSVSLCGMGNSIHKCWRYDHDWKSDLLIVISGLDTIPLVAAMGRTMWLLTYSSDDDPASSKPDKLCYAVIQNKLL